MKNSKGETLTQPYLDLARMRREQQPIFGASLGFAWNNTPEEYVFWSCVNRGETPDIPAASLAELEEWRKAKGLDLEKLESDLTEALSKETPESLKEFLHRDEPDWKAMYEELELEANELTAALKELGAKYDELKAGDPDRNWVAECAMRHYTFRDGDPVYSWARAEAWAAEGRKRGHIN